MHYYKRNIGDYHKKAGRLSLLQHGVYNILIDACYDREKFPTKDEAIDWCWAETEEEIAAVEFVLKKFFTEEDGIYIQDRIKSEIQEYKSFCDLQAKKGRKGGRPKKPGGLPTETNGNPDESRKKPKPLTTNHKPLTSSKAVAFIAPTLDEVIHYGGIRGQPESLARRFFDYFDTGDWIDSSGKKVKNWKQKFITWESKNETHSRSNTRQESNHAQSIRRNIEIAFADDG